MILGVAAYPPLGAGALAFVMLAPIVTALEGRRPRSGFAIFYMYTAAMNLVVVRWLVHGLVEGYGVAAAPAWIFTVLLVAAYAAIPSAAAAVYCALRPHLRPALAPLVFAALLTLAGWLYAEPLGIPWLLPAHPLASIPIALQTADLVDEAGVPLLTGALRSEEDRIFNSTVLLAPGAGWVESYDKQWLVPFAESDPALSSLLEPLLGPVLDGDPYEAGREARVLRGAGVPLATPICFEITDAALVRRFRERGAEILINLSNDAWFGRTGYAEMHFAHAVFRAVETRSWVLRNANGGVSGVVDPAGRFRRGLPDFREGTFVAELRTAGAAPFYARAGDAPLLALLLGVVGAGVAAANRRGVS